MPTDVSPFPMVEVPDAIALILANTAPLPAETVRPEYALDRVLAEDVRSSIDYPSFVASTVDGYAVRSEDGDVTRTIRGDITAGTVGEAIQPGEAARIMTGAPLPEGADTVVMLEYVTTTEGKVTPEMAPPAGDNLRLIGSDIGNGDLVLASGSTIGPVDIGLLATLGVQRVSVRRLPRVAVLSTGDEVILASGTPTGSQIRDSNGPALVATIRQWGFPVEFLGIAPDSEEAQYEAVRRGLERADVVLTTGGVSVGSRDLIKPIFARLGTLHFGRINFRPGKPLTFATAGEKVLFGLPGNPVSASVCLTLFVKPALRRLAGHSDVSPVFVSAVAGEAFRGAGDRPDFQRGIGRYEGGKLVVRGTGSQASSRLRSLSGSNVLLHLPMGVTRVEAGEPLDVILTGPLTGDSTLG